MTVAGFLATVAGLLVRFGVYSGMMGGGRSRDNSAAVFLVVILVSVLVYVLSFLLLRALSRYREYAADRGAAIITGAPAQLASALQKISGSMSRIPTQDLRAAEGMNAFFIMPAVAKGFSLSSIVATHPPTEKRIERLLAMQAQIDGSPAAAVLPTDGPARRPARPADPQARRPRRPVRDRQRGDDAAGRGSGSCRPGRAGVCFKEIEAGQFAALVREIEDLLRVAAPESGDDREPPTSTSTASTGS